MAVNDKDQNTNKPATPNALGSAFQAAQESAAQQRGGAQQNQGRQNAGFSFRNMGGIARPAMGRTPASEVLSKLTKVIATVYEENIDKSFEYGLIPVDMNTTTTLGVSVLILTMLEKANPETGVSFHTLIVEASAEAPAPRFESINGQNVEILRTVGEAYDDNMLKVVTDHVRRQYPQSKLLNAEACVVPRDFSVSDEDAVFKLASNAAFANSSELETNRAGFFDLNLANAESDSTLTVRTSFGNPPSLNAVNHPLRSDIKIDFSAAPNNQNNQQVVERVTPVAHLDGYIDLVWDPAQVSQNMFAQYSPQAVASYQRYAARYVLTALESQNLLTIPAQLLALIPALSLRENNQWVQSFRSQNFGEGIDMHDIGAVGIEANFENNPSGYGLRVDTRADTFKPEHHHRLVTSVVKPGLILSLDVPECGPQTWYNGVFAVAAEGNPKANAAIIDAANHLTNGEFAKHFSPNGRVAVDENNRIHLGFYVDRNGVKQDIRNIDYLAVMNLVGEKDPSIIRQWSDTFFPTQSLAVRLAARKRIITGLVADVTLTGFARRVTFEVEFVEALAKGIAANKLSIRSISPYADAGNYERAQGGFTGNTLMSGDTTGLFNRGGFGQTQAFGSNRAFGGRSW
jgi:hypothetical protein